VIARRELDGMSGLSTEPFHEVVRRSVPGGRLLRAWPLVGGSSAMVTALEVAVGPSRRRQKLVVRQHGQSHLERHPEAAADEYRLLRALAATAVPAPKPVFLDRSSEVLGQPYLVIEYIEGGPGDAPDDTDWVATELAAQLALVHGVAIGELLWLPRKADLVAQELARGLDGARLAPELGAAAELLEATWPWPAAAQGDAGVALLHGDFWSGNVLWRDGRAVGLVDWEDAALGDPAADLANGRLEALWAYGEQAMHVFTARYCEHAGRELGGIGLGYWDLWTAVVTAGKMSGWGLDAPTEARLREQGRWFAGKAAAAVKREA